MLSIKDLAGDDRQATISYGEHEVHVNYRPSTIDTPFATRTGNLCDILADLIDSWDVVEDGTPYPLTGEAIGRLPIAFQRRVYEGVLDDNRSVGLPEVPGPSDAS